MHYSLIPLSEIGQRFSNISPISSLSGWKNKPWFVWRHRIRSGLGCPCFWICSSLTSSTQFVYPVVEWYRTAGLKQRREILISAVGICFYRGFTEVNSFHKLTVAAFKVHKKSSRHWCLLCRCNIPVFLCASMCALLHILAEKSSNADIFLWSPQYWQYATWFKNFSCFRITICHVLPRGDVFFVQAQFI